MGIIFRKNTIFYIAAVFPERFFKCFSDVGIFFYKFRCEVIIHANHICINQQLTICV